MIISNSLLLSEVRKIILSNQLLISGNNYSSKSGIYRIIEKLGYIQIDTISVVERSHHHILWSRMPSYQKTFLDELLEKDKLIFEYWSHAASYLPMKDFRFSLLRKRNYSDKYKEWKISNRKIIGYVYDRIRSEGPLQSKDFDDKKSGTSGWWNWKPSKDALDFLFHSGELMIAKRSGFQKVYDLTERVLPENTDISIPSVNEFYRHLADKNLKSFGIFREKEVMYQRSYDKTEFKKVLNQLTEEKIIAGVKVKGFKDDIFYTSESNIEALANIKLNNMIHILSPFDNLIIQRKRIKDLFDFDYQLECYLPQNKRKFGYFCLPVLCGSRFIARIDAKASRADNIFLVKNMFQDKDFKNSAYSKKLLKKTAQLANFTSCAEVKGM
ncbi:MAG: YcaQ family DNA glycosylase [Ignavibacteria bacterium]|nr:YcaQ family DNA glycosylase [Ignavibacteria bacterium]